jgi:hypothetical protein
MAVETVTLQDNTSGLSISATVTYDATTLAISEVAWSNLGSVDTKVVVEHPGQLNITFTCRAGRTGNRRNISGYFLGQAAVVLGGDP